MSELPEVPPAILNPVRQYFIAFKRRLEALLRSKADKIEGTVYISEEQPLEYIDADGIHYRFGQDAIPPMPSKTGDNLYFGTNTFRGPVVLRDNQRFTSSFDDGPVLQLGGPMWAPEHTEYGLASVYVGSISEWRHYIQGGFGRFAMAWNAYWDNAASAWKSIKSGEYHLIITESGPITGIPTPRLFLGTATSNPNSGDTVSFQGLTIDGRGLPYVNENSVIWSGNNANGSTTKFYDGTLMCRANVVGAEFTVLPNPVTTQGINVYRATYTWKFPTTFAATDDLVVQVSGDQSSNNLMSYSVYSLSTTQVTIEAASLWDFAVQAPGRAFLLAVGRWR